MIKHLVVGVSLVAMTSGSVLAWSSDEQRAKEFFSKGLESKAERYLTNKVEGALDGKVNEFEIDLTICHILPRRLKLTRWCQHHQSGCRASLGHE